MLRAVRHVRLPEPTDDVYPAQPGSVSPPTGASTSPV
jgi:hypothetical protein